MFICSEFYEPGAMMLEDEGMVFTGLLVGLNVIDCNMCIKEEDLDQPVCGSVLKWTIYYAFDFNGSTRNKGFNLLI